MGHESLQAIRAAHHHALSGRNARVHRFAAVPTITHRKKISIALSMCAGSLSQKKSPRRNPKNAMNSAVRTNVYDWSME